MENTSLLYQLKEASNLSDEQAIKALVIVADYTKEKYPILEGNINSFIRQEFKHTDPDLLSRIIEDWSS